SLPSGARGAGAGGGMSPQVKRGKGGIRSVGGPGARAGPPVRGGFGGGGLTRRGEACERSAHHFLNRFKNGSASGTPNRSPGHPLSSIAGGPPPNRSEAMTNRPDP